MYKLSNSVIAFLGSLFVGFGSRKGPNEKVIIFSIFGGLIVVSISVIFSSLSFWFNKSDLLAETMNSLMVNFATYPDTIFKGAAKVMLYTIVPVGISTYLPVHLIIDFDISLLLIFICVSILLVIVSFIIFNKGLKRYSSSNLMIARI